jgi:hypothetical protein
VTARPLTDKERQEFRKDRPKPGYRWFAKEHRKYQNWLRRLPRKIDMSRSTDTI